MATLGEVIRARREALGLTQEELALRIGDAVRQAEVSRLEHDRIVLPRRDRLERIATALDLPLGVLLASSGWVGAAQAFPPQHEPPDAATNGLVALNEVLEAAKDVVAHLQELVDAAEAATPHDGLVVDADRARLTAD
jgi:transcriptional regulator with XRE-family HTH domain